MKNLIVKGSASLVLILSMCFSSCQKMERPEMDIIADDSVRMNAPLQMYLPFENSVLDSAQYQKGTESNVTYVNGVRGMAYKGASNAQLQFPSALKMATMTSFTVSFWMNTEKHDGGAQCIFMLPNTEDFWGNMFMTIEGNNSPTDNTMLAKFNFVGNWVEFTGNNGLNRWPDMYGKWNHVVFTYDEVSSKFSTYINGSKLDLPANVTDRKNGSNPLGPLSFKNVSKFVIGGFQQHIGIRSPADSWMLHYTGLLDQFRVYTRALSDTEVGTLYTTKE